MMAVMIVVIDVNSSRGGAHDSCFMRDANGIGA